jgi:hypothetical protein
MTNASVVCFQKSLKVSSSSSPIMAACFNALKISRFMSLPSPELSLLS